MAFADRINRRLYHSEQLPDPGFIKTIFSSPKMAIIFLPLRLYLGWQWLTAGVEKINNPAWTRNGAALKGFWVSATKVDAGAKGAVIHYGWYHDFLTYMLNNQWYTWFGKVVAFSETTIGIAMILGAFVGVAAFAGAFMNFNFMLAGSASTNPVLFALAILLVLGWKVAGYLGADYGLLPSIGTPWKLGHVVDFARSQMGRTADAGRTVLGAAAFVTAFAVAGVLIVVANNQLREQPVVGWLVALFIVAVAWLVGEAALSATHESRTSVQLPMSDLAPKPRG